jgi:CRISPR/Cas system-associated exonuclease Cas4 (RecB family)
MKPPHETLLDSQEQLFRELVEKQKQDEYTIRFDRLWVSASSIAEQYFCEQKVELRHHLGEIATEEKQRGSEAHEELTADAVATSRAELFESIYSDQLTIAQEMAIMSRYRDLVLLGQVDAIVFQRGQVLMLFEFKFSQSRIPYHSYHVQAEVYGKILEGMGFDISNLHYVIAVVPPAARNENTLFHTIVDTAWTNGLKEAQLNVGPSYVYVYPYRSLDAEHDIDWALDYWRNSREAIPTRNSNKCRSCEYHDSCDMKLN